MPIVSRGYSPDQDLPSIMGFLRDAYMGTRTIQNWLPTRFENSYNDLVSDVRIWEEIDAAPDSSSSPTIVAMANPEIPFRYFIQIHPDHTHLEEEIVRWIEDHCTAMKPDPDREQKLSIIILDGNPTREDLLRERGFEMGLVYGLLRVRPVDAPIPDFAPPEGFEIRSVRPETDFDEIAKAVRVIFGHGEGFTAETLEWLAGRSFYHEDLDLVAVAPDGNIASFCTFRVDPPSRITELEPMGTHPDYRGLGLAKALLCEGFRRLRRYNPTLLYIGGAANNPAANRLYESVGLRQENAYHYWSKMI
jgi:ribosomal protein S18 acetylase RimI-like enzyme